MTSSPSLRYYLALVAVVLISSPIILVVRSQDQVLEAVKCWATFPNTSVSMSSIYVGDGKIYIFGGWTGDRQDAIYLDDVYADTITRVGDMVSPTVGQALLDDGQGNILHFGGTTVTIGLDEISRFNTSSRVTEVVGRLPRKMETMGAVKHKADAALVFEQYGDTVEVNLTTFEATHIGDIPLRHIGVAWDGVRDNVVLIGFINAHHLYSISENNVTNFTSPEPHRFFVHHDVISTHKSAWIVGNQGSQVGRGNTIVQVDFDTLEFKFWEVNNYPALPNQNFYYAAPAYVPELHRMYMFGGRNVTHNFKDIWYIDLPDETTTPPPTTPSPSPDFDCSNRTDGFYASPFACERYFGCRGGETSEYVCPPPFHFNPDLEVCDLPEVVKCDLSCSGKEDGLYPHSQYCSFYLRCLEGVGRVVECPAPLLFDRVELKCNFPDLVNCTTTV